MTQIPGVLRGADATGRLFFDRVEVVSIDQFGARVRTRFRLNPGREVELGLPTEPEEKRMRVVWCGDAETFYEGIVGLEFADADACWNAETLHIR